MSIWKDRVPELETLLQTKTLTELGQHYGVTKQQMSLVLKRYLPHYTRQDYGLGKAKKERIEKRTAEVLRKYNRTSYMSLTDYDRAFSAFFTRKRQNAKSKGKWEFTIEMSDVPYWPTHCPILGLELDWFLEKRGECSPSLDRIDSNLGYVPGNVRIVSWRANRIKNNGTAEEHRKIADYLDSIST